jgi:hypothetical protein
MIRQTNLLGRGIEGKPISYMSRTGPGLGEIPGAVHGGLESRRISHPLLGQDLKYSVQTVSDDPDQQVGVTIGLMCRYAQEDSRSPEIQHEAHAIASACLGDKRRMIQEIWSRVQKKIQFLNDERTSQPIEPLLSKTYGDAPVVEILIRPRDMSRLSHRIGDCDDYSMYAASLLLALGIDCSFVTIAGNRNDPAHFSHVYVAAYPDGFSGERIAVDSSHGPYCGWEGKIEGARCREWKVSSGLGEPRDSGLLSTVMFIGVAVGFATWALR